MIPVGTDVRLRRRPVGNWILIALNVLAFFLTSGPEESPINRALPPLSGALPSLHEYITYQFRHGDSGHLFGNMIFLWIFGNAVCDRMGSLAYCVFYLAGGVVAGVIYAQFNTSALVGASGAIAGVTTAFLALYPRVHVMLLAWPLILTPFQLPAMIVIVFKIILWDNIIAPKLGGGIYSPVAYSAHLGGYAYGLTVALTLLATRALPRNQFDLLALWNRWRRRTGLTTDVVLPDLAGGPFPKQVSVRESGSRPIEIPKLSPADQLREDIVDRLSQRDVDEALALHERLMRMDADQVLPRQHQLEIANYLARQQRYVEAAKAYEGYLSAYPSAADSGQVRLFAGMIYGRYLSDTLRAAQHLRAALPLLTTDSQRQLAEAELARLG